MAEIALAVGGAFLSSALNVLFDRLAPHGDLLKMFQKHKHDDGLLEKLEDNFLGLQIVLSDAENKQASDPSVRKWLNKLQCAVDGAENLLEEVNYEALRLKVEGQHLNLAETSNQQASDLNIEEKLKDTIKKLEVLEKQIGRLGLQKHVDSGKKLEIRTPSTSVVDESEIFGREIEIERLIDCLLSNDANGKNLTVVPIVEMGGLGKTTLAKAAYNDKMVTDHFELKAWTCVSEPYDALRISKELLQEIDSFDLKDDNNLNRLQVKLKEKLNRKRFLIVLDDMWNDNYEKWDELRSLFVQGSTMLEQSRHLSYSMGKGGDFKKLNRLSKSEQLRTFLPINIQGLYFPKLSRRVLHNILPRLTSSRALSLSHYEIVELPDALFIKLKLLRFLDLSRTEIKKLLDSICALYNLETLLLSSCAYLEELPLQIENLINLCHLDISDTSHLKMPLHLSKLKSLQVLVGAKFLLGGWRMEDLGEASYLYGSLSVLELENVVDRREAQKAKMRDEKKNHVEKLSLEWSGSDADNSQTERDILDELCPHTNIKELQISGYRGTQFPNWLADDSFLKLLVQLSLSNCKDCFSLPALGQLPCLRFLSIREIHSITEITEDFYGSPSSEKPFNSLEKLVFAEMPEWKQWHVLGNGEFPALQDLSIYNCPKLVGKFPENLCSLTNLRISRCPELNLETPIQLSSSKRFEVWSSPKAGVVFDEAELFTSQLELMKQIEVLNISYCNSLTSLPISTLPSTLKRIRINRRRKLKLEAPDSSKMNSNMFLEELELDECDSTSSPELVPTARYFRVERCQNLTRFLIPNGTGRLYINCCENLEILLLLWHVGPR